MQKSVSFLFTYSELAEKEIKKIYITIASKRTQNLGIYLAKEMK